MDQTQRITEVYEIVDMAKRLDNVGHTDHAAQIAVIAIASALVEIAASLQSIDNHLDGISHAAREGQTRRAFEDLNLSKIENHLAELASAIGHFEGDYLKVQNTR
jgi:hypothetical protein